MDLSTLKSCTGNKSEFDSTTNPFSSWNNLMSFRFPGVNKLVPLISRGEDINEEANERTIANTLIIFLLNILSNL